MIMDKKWIVHDNANCFASGADFSSTDLVDTLSAESDIGTGLPMRVRVVITTAVTGGTSIQAAVADCDTEGGTYVKRLYGDVVAVAAALAGKVLLDTPLPSLPKLQRYVKVVFVNVGANAAGKADALFYAGR
jgi:hypothetical protein